MVAIMNKGRMFLNNRMKFPLKVIYVSHNILLLILSAGRFLTKSIFQQQVYRFIIYYCLIVVSTFWIVNPSISTDIINRRKMDRGETLRTRIFGITTMGTVIIKLIELFT